MRIVNTASVCETTLNCVFAEAAARGDRRFIIVVTLYYRIDGYKSVYYSKIKNLIKPESASIITFIQTYFAVPIRF
jgi:hypothetical protein